jgi:predicted pyridoxine 5'-phosphate oxidase superfamily flavin-nucleotide-binding protein
VTIPGAARQEKYVRRRAFRRRRRLVKLSLMVTALSSEIRAFIDRPNFGHLATLRPDGAPQVTPVWIGREGYRVLVGTG